jgi:hypothetical protein
MSWHGDWYGTWLGWWYGTQEAGDGSIHAASAQTLAGTVGDAVGNLAIAATSAAEVASTQGEASGAVEVAGASVVTLGDVDSVAVALPAPVRPVGAGWVIGTRRLAPVAGRSVVTLDDVSSTRPAVPRTERQRKGRRDDEYLLGMVAGWR